MKKLSAFVLFLALSAYSCTHTPKEKEESITVSILPIKYLVENITGSDFRVEVLVPPGASPETYEPTPSQLITLSDSKLVMTTGLIDFEQQLSVKLRDNIDKNRLVDLSRGIDVIRGGDHGHGHDHGVDPHIWTSPKELRQMARTAWESIALLYPDSSRYRANYQELDARLDSLDRELGRKFAQSGTRSFMVYHPALTYLAREYGLEQISIEHEGKEPSAEQLKRIVARAKADNIDKLLYQNQFSRAAVETVAAEIGGKAVEIDPLREDVVENLKQITDLITE